jgi:carnitine-CoA ligase
MLDRAAVMNPSGIVAQFPDGGSRLSFADLMNESCKVAGGLLSLGLLPHERVGIMLGNRPEYLLAWFGSLIAGTVDVAINHGLVGEILLHQLRIAKPRAIIVDAASFDAVKSVLGEAPDIQFVICVDRTDTTGLSVQMLQFEALVREKAMLPLPVSPDRTALIRMTSGTTGPAKGVAMTHSQLTVMSSYFNWLVQFTANDRLYTCFPLHHGLATLGVISAINAQGSCVIDARFSASRYWDRIRANEATLAHVLNPVVNILLSTPESAVDREHRCTRLWTAHRNAAFENRFGTRLIPHYSMSEGNIIAFDSPGEPGRPGSCGRISPLFELRIANADGTHVAPGDEGEILWRPREAHLMMAGYDGDSEATVAACRDLWFHSGDQGHLDSDGYLYLSGRQGDQIRRKGVNIAAYHIERAALLIPSVIEAAAIAVPSDIGESEVKLCLLVNEQPPAIEAAVNILKAQLPKEMVPRYIEFRRELPRTATHKISKAQLRAEGRNGLTPSTIDTDRRAPIESD